MFAGLPRTSLPLSLCSALLAACGGSQTLEYSLGPCIEGQSASCDCANGSVGVQTCGGDSHYGECTCPSGAAGTSSGSNGAGTTGGAAGTSIDPVAGTSAGGAGGGGISGSTGGAGAMAGGVGGTGATTGGVGGMTGGSPATGGSGGAPGTTGGAGGMTGSTGGSGGGPDPGRDPRPGELYGDCLASGTCKAGLLCISDGSSGVPMSYCTATCSGLDMRCPRSSGDRMVTCVLGICVR